MPNCNGCIYIQPCRGHGGYPVTHFWRECGDTVYFQAKGTHDHVKPDLKPVRDTAARRRKQHQNQNQTREFFNTIHQSTNLNKIKNSKLKTHSKFEQSATHTCGRSKKQIYSNETLFKLKTNEFNKTNSNLNSSKFIN